MATTEKDLNIGENTAETPKLKAMSDWKRWNNYDIALLDQRQFPASADAFAKVIELDEKYRPFALTNQALMQMELDEWKEARKRIDRALKLDPNNFRAVFQRGRIERVEGNLDAAEADYHKPNKGHLSSKKLFAHC